MTTPTEPEALAIDFKYWLLDAARILHTNGTTTHADWVEKACEHIASTPAARMLAGEGEAVGLLREMIRLADLGLEASLREPEENGNYVAYNRAKAFLDGRPEIRSINEALRDIPDEIYRHVAESKDVSHARSRVADLVSRLPLYAHPPAADPVGLRDAVTSYMKARDVIFSAEHTGRDAGGDAYADLAVKDAQLRSLLAATPARTDDAAQADGEWDFAVGDPVEKFTGEAQWSGWIASRYMTRSGKQRYVVEVDPQGFQMIAVPSQLRSSTQAAYPTGSGEGEA